MCCQAGIELAVIGQSEEVDLRNGQWVTGYLWSKSGDQRQESKQFSNPVPLNHKVAIVLHFF